MKTIMDRHGRRLRLRFIGRTGAVRELGADELRTALGVRRSLPRLAGAQAFAAYSGRSQDLCDRAVRRLLGISPVRAELEIQGEGAALFRTPADLGNFLNDIYLIAVRDQYNASGVKGGTIVDAGANIGIFTLYALALGARKVLAFEAVKETFGMLLDNLALNRAGRRVRAVNIALGAGPGEATLKFNSRGEGSAMLEDAGADVNRDISYSGTRTVKVAPLDRLVRGRADFIKMDLEGYEAQALLGASGLIAKCRPVLSFAAYHKKDDRETLPRLVRSLRKDYRITFCAFGEEDFFCE